MKKIAILLPLAALSLIACVKPENQETKNNRLVWAESVESKVPLMRPGEYDEGDDEVQEREWYSVFKYNKQNIFISIKKAMLTGKLKAYPTAYYAQNQENPVALTPKEIENLFVRYDSVEIEDSSKPNRKYKDVVKTEITRDYISSLKFYETLELDTISYNFVKRVSAVSFFCRARDLDVGGKGEGEYEIFHVKFNDASVMK